MAVLGLIGGAAAWFGLLCALGWFFERSARKQAAARRLLTRRIAVHVRGWP